MEKLQPWTVFFFHQVSHDIGGEEAGEPLWL